jgi:hypothetical protein
MRLVGVTRMLGQATSVVKQIAGDQGRTFWQKWACR